MEEINEESVELARKQSERDEKESKVVLLSQKVEELTDKLAMEKERGAKLKEAAPPEVKDDRDAARGAIKKCRHYLEETEPDEQSFFDHSISIREDQSGTWEFLQIHLANLSRHNIWNEALQIQQDTIADILETIKNVCDRPLTKTEALGVIATKIDASKLETCTSINQKRGQCGEAKNQCDDALNQAIQMLENNLAVGESYDSDENDLIKRYVMALAKDRFYKAKVAALSDTLKSLQLKESRGFEKSEELKNICKETQNLYIDIVSLSRKLEDSAEMLRNLKLAIDMSGASMDELIRNRFRAERMGANGSNLSDMTLLSSTLGFGCSLPKYVEELELFDKLSVYSVKASLLTPERMNWQPNPFLRETSHIPFHYISLQGVEERFARMHQWNQSVDSALVEASQQGATYNVETNLYQSLQTHYRERIIEKLDRAEKTHKYGKELLEKTEKEFTFLYENLFEKYVPRTVLVEGRTFLEYRNEYEMLMNLRDRAK